MGNQFMAQVTCFLCKYKALKVLVYYRSHIKSQVAPPYLTDTNHVKGNINLGIHFTKMLDSQTGNQN